MMKQETDDTAGGEETPQGARCCDFCGKAVTTVRRVALDGDYERLRTPHHELYACEPCSRSKERARLGIDRG